MINYEIKGKILRCNLCEVMVRGYSSKKVAPKLTHDGQDIENDFPCEAVK